MARLQLRNLDIVSILEWIMVLTRLLLPKILSSFSPQLNLFWLLWLQEHTGKPSGIPSATYCCLLSDFKNLLSLLLMLLHFISLLHLSPLNTLYNYSFILFSVFPHDYGSSIKAGLSLFRSLLYFYQLEQSLTHSKCSINNCWMKNE